MKVLITGFDPFGGEKINPALEAVKAMKDNIAGAEIIKLEIPTVFRKSVEKISAAIEAHNPDIVISIGQAGGRFDITPERVAINMDDARIKDNDGKQPIDEVIENDGASAYFSNLPIKAMVKHMKENGIPSSVSNTAGTFVCNHVMYGILYMVDKKYPNIRGGFIHVPFIPSQVLDKKNTPSMSVNDITKGLELAVEAAVLNSNDIKEVGGAVC
ncbi:pyroglutamyl-peptidase I . Cysteine peptidase. MEROPS family C15 [Clostridium collagenovorans DSM 3089]|uniref:Pyrrolidone-carboxylate peptidase n=1 Tax=Clostridium collagenovorans DSM 3089 TaxID=1121306 RepID=A0A1M5TTD3_9CLOT|nr:pyroglutamyl-peptidase I [Clostridium collagenovorans]SHH53984.1 pyroglutamyl-peptidase I . Cysteine peptidase. MEROPS family C15 [Clostridium collagenovorans DSM 3089]